MSIASDILNLFGVKLSNKDRIVLKKLIYITLMIILFLLVCYFIIGSYLVYDKFILPSLKQKIEDAS